MLSKQAVAGRAGKLDGLESALDRLGIRGGGVMRIDDDCSSPRMRWISAPSRSPDYKIAISKAFDAASGILAGNHLEIITMEGRSGEAGAAGLKKGTEAVEQDLDPYQARIDYLRREAALDGDQLNGNSEADFRKFVGSASDLRTGGLVLMDSGNLRAIWKDGEGSRLGLQFLGGGMVQYVVFKRRRPEQQISRVAGRDTFKGIWRQVDAFDLGSLLYE